MIVASVSLSKNCANNEQVAF